MASTGKLISDIKLNARNAAANGAATLRLTSDAIAHMDESGDWTPLAWVVGAASDSDKSRLKRIIEAATGCKTVSCKKQPSGHKIVRPKATDSNSAPVVDRRHILSAYVTLGVTFRSKVLENGVETIPALLVKNETVFDLAKRLQSAVNAAKDEGFSDAVIRQTLDACLMQAAA